MNECWNCTAELLGRTILGTEACRWKDAEVWIAAHLKNLGREILRLYKKLFAERFWHLSVSKKWSATLLLWGNVSYDIPKKLGIGLGKPWSSISGACPQWFFTALFCLQSWMGPGGWQQCDRAGNQFQVSQCVGAGVCGGLSHPCDISCSSLSCWGLCWPKPAPGGSTELGAAAVSLSAPKSVLWRLR